MWIAIGVLAAIAVTICIIVVVNRAINEKVKKNSDYYKSVEQLNDETKFFSIDTQLLSKMFYLNSKRAFDNFNISKHAQDYIKSNEIAFEELLKRIDNNKTTQKNYNDKFSRIAHTSDTAIAKKAGISLKKFVKRETKLSDKIKKIGTIDLSLSIRYQYTSPAGRNHYESGRKFSLNDIKQILNTVSITSKKNRSKNPVYS